MTLRNLAILLSFALVSVGCAAAPKPAASPTPAPVAEATPAFTAPQGWKTVRGNGFVFAVPKNVSEVTTTSEDGPKFSAKSEDNKFILGFDYKPGIVNVKRHSGGVVDTFHEMDAEIQQISQVEIDERDGVAILAVHGEHAFLVFAFVKDKIGYQLACGTPDKDEAQAMVDTCEAVAETFKFTK